MKYLLTIWIWLSCVLGVWAISPKSDFPVFWSAKEKYVALRDVAAVYGMSISKPAAQRITLQDRTQTIVFKTDGREVLYGGNLIWLHAPVSFVRGRWAMREVDLRVVLDPLHRPERYLKSVRHRVIVLDPGHGGQDTGAKGKRGVEEKRVALDLARRLRAHLVNAGYKVYLTRENDRFIELDERCRKAARWGADLFLSIHLNSAGSEAAAGVETYALAAAGYESTSGGLSNLTQPGNRYESANGVLAYQIQRALTQRLGAADRGVKRSRFLVLKNAPCPAVLIECAFVSNAREEAQLLDDAHREVMAQAIARGTLNYLNLAKRAQSEAP
ncbi:MAG: N-acetylmuramoyl-L-alanine amidase [Verrucomicrobia bacterium]|nr:N-acetylmuramoyl-L-alanine amidase [Kiritimatiellia bacterium]MCO6400301.1 N-acetylmuramoyl-L-alanine amidase [Verrucomicrobiota bacterium]